MTQLVRPLEEVSLNRRCQRTGSFHFQGKVYETLDEKSLFNSYKFLINNKSQRKYFLENKKLIKLIHGMKKSRGVDKFLNIV